MTILTKAQQAQLIVELAVIASVKDGKIVTKQIEVLLRIAALVRQETDYMGDEDGAPDRAKMNHDVVTFLAEMRSKPMREMDASGRQYVAAVLDRLKETRT
jgi:hypothetical protein